ncbi:MAG: hypothetical protein HOV79_29245 [Hamadaea sp.]|nr:hypothetical protein [Hamadaea sp.]
MPVYYRGPTAQVTHEVFLVSDPAVEAYAISELHDVHVAICGRRTYELRAVYHGRPTTLFRSTDQRVFGQVRRALVRALEHNSDTV